MEHRAWSMGKFKISHSMSCVRCFMDVGYEIFHHLVIVTFNPTSHFSHPTSVVLKPGPSLSNGIFDGP